MKSRNPVLPKPPAKPMAPLFAALGFLAIAVVGGLIFLLLRRPPGPAGAAIDPASVAVSEPALSYVPQMIGLPVEGHPMITHLAIYDLDGDGLPDILVCDATANRVSWMRQFPRGVFMENLLGDPIPGPAHISVADVNGDGKPDLLVASMGVIMPNNDRIGKVVVLENLGGGVFRNRDLIENVARVTDIRGADLNGDGRVDLVVGQYGYEQGEIRWMENLGDWNFRSHILFEKPGTIMTPVADFDRDGKPDFAAVVAQNLAGLQEVHWFHNLGNGNFQDNLVWKSPNENWSGSGLDVADINGDGLPDLIYSNGDGFTTAFAGPAPWHGLQWLENQGGTNFVYHRIGDMPGCYSPVGADLNGDGHQDIVAVSAFNKATDTTSVWMTAWLNDGHEQFTPVPLAYAPTHLITLAVGDLDGKGMPSLITGGFFAYPPYSQMARVTLWQRQ